MRRTISLFAATLATTLVASACTATSTSPPDDPTGPAGNGPTILPAAFQLQPAESCDDLLDHFVDNALKHVGPWGLGGGFGVMEGPIAFDLAEESAAAVDDGARQGGQADVDYSTTNVQEVGVDEPDVVKTNGELIVVVHDDQVVLIDATDGAELSRVDLDEDLWNLELLLAGDQLVVSGTQGGGGGWWGRDVLGPAFSVQRTMLVRVDISDPAAPEVTGTATIEGSIRTMRMVDDVVRVVIASQPTGLNFTTPEDGGLQAEGDAEAANRDIVRDSDIDDWLPHVRIDDEDGQGEVTQLLDCEDVGVPSEFQGFETLSVLTLDMGESDITPTSTAGVVATGDTVYASTDRLIVATSPWGQWRVPMWNAEDDASPDADEVLTQLHAFDISDPDATSYVGSGAVEGTLVNQFALSEVDGTIRVATTINGGWWRGGGEASESALVVLRERGNELVEVGRVDGLGRTERIYSVRYLSPDVAAIVTFRETDPLYLVDSSDPTNPFVAGELKIPGFSTYLHDVGNGRLVGVGQDATDRGRTTGLQVSLFDITDLSDPRRVDTVTLPKGHSPAEYDHRAFLWWEQTGQVVVPAEAWARRKANRFTGLLSIDVAERTLSIGARHNSVGDGVDRWEQSVERTLVIGDDLWAVSWRGLTRHDLATLDVKDRITL